MRTNLATNPAPTTTAGFTSVASTIAYDSTNAGVHVTCTADGTTDRGLNFGGLVPIASLSPYTTYTVSVDVLAVVADGYRVSAQGGWVPVRVDSAYTAIAAGQKARLSITVRTASVMSGNTTIYVLRQNGSVASEFVVSHFLFENAAAAGTYFDGSTTGTPQTLYAWTGTANASTSTASDWVTAVQTSDPGAPQVGVTVANLSTTTGCTVVVETSWDGGATWNAVRGGTVAGALGSTFIRDYVPALNIPILYRATITGGTTFAALGATFTATSTTAWIQDPLAPRSAVPLYANMSSGHILLTLGSLATSTWAQHVDLAVPIGSSLAAASISVRQKVAALPLVLTYDVAAEGGALRRVLMGAGQLVIRGLSSLSTQLDPVAHVTVGDASEARFAANTVAQWTLTARQVRPVTMRVIVPWFTYNDVKTLVQSQVGSTATFDQVKAAMPAGKTYTSWVANPGVV